MNPALGNWGKVEFEAGWHPVHGTDKKMFVCESFMEELEKGLVTSLKKPNEYLSFISLKDEVLDPAVTLELLRETNLIRIPEGDHRISDFRPHIQAIMEFLRQS